jgi:glycosyltransferase involved in cell wall biosynthesis
MQRLIGSKLNDLGTPISVIPNWADVDQVVPKPQNENSFRKEWRLDQKFVIQFSGNIGRTASIETMIDSAQLLMQHTDIHFLFVGVGVKRPFLDLAIRDRGLTNVSVSPPQPRESLCELLNASDVVLIGLISGMTGVSVPSRLYNALAAGKPIIALAEPNSEIALVVKEESIGWVVPPDDPNRLVQAILEARNSPEQLAAMGQRARAVAEAKYRFDQILASYRGVLRI